MRKVLFGVMSLALLSVSQASAQERRTGDSLLNMDPIIERCSGGMALSVEGKLQGQIADEYGKSDLEGDAFVLNRQGAIFSGATPSERIELLKIFTDCIKALISAQAGQYLPEYAEPTEREMLRALQGQLGGYYDESTGRAIIQNPLNGMEMTFDYFRKHQCRISTNSTGYICTYSIKVGTKFFSNDGTAAGNSHAGAVNALLELLGGGSKRPATVTEKRFVKDGDTWSVTER